MKSTIKIDFDSRNEGSQPVIKIIQPADCLDEQSPDFDVKDKLLRDFLHTPCNINRNNLFKLGTCFPFPHEGVVKLNIATIKPVDIKDAFYLFKHDILNKIIPDETLILFNGNNERLKSIPGEENYKKIIDFFDWLDALPWVNDK